MKHTKKKYNVSHFGAVSKDCLSVVIAPRFRRAAMKNDQGAVAAFSEQADIDGEIDNLHSVASILPIHDFEFPIFDIRDLFVCNIVYPRNF